MTRKEEICTGALKYAGVTTKNQLFPVYDKGVNNPLIGAGTCSTPGSVSGVPEPSLFFLN